ncbi:EF-hand domain (C-terminal) containing, partial [Perkinsus olseni]
AQPKKSSLVKEDKDYAAAAACRSVEAAETAKIRRAVREVGDVFYKHPSMSHRIIKELSKVSDNQMTDTGQIRLALLRLGFPFDQEEIDRCVCFVMTPESDEPIDLYRVKFVDFVKAIVATQFKSSRCLHLNNVSKFGRGSMQEPKVPPHRHRESHVRCDVVGACVAQSRVDPLRG